MNPRVFVVNEPLRRNDEGIFERAVDITPACEYGELVMCLPAGAPPVDQDVSIRQLWNVLSSYTADDYLLPIGHPALIAYAAVIAAEMADGKLKVLNWQRKLGRYVVLNADIFKDGEPT